MEKFNKITLDNGLRIILAPKNDSFSTTVLVLVEAGSKYEVKEINGISHFLEHMCFKGTTKRPRAIDIVSELDGLGASYNAFTSHEYTGYWVKTLPIHFDKTLDIVSDMYLNSVFDQKEIEKEKGVIIEEINMTRDDPKRYVWDIWTELLYGDQPAGWDILGTKETVQKINSGDFLKYKNEHYLASSTIIVVSGKFNEEAVEKIKSAFSEIKINEKIQKIKTKESQENSQVLLKHKESDQTHLILGVRAYDIFDKRKYALQVLSHIIGGSMSSRLFQKIREEMGAAYYAWASADLFTDHGYLVALIGADNKRIKEVISATIEELKKMTEDLVGDKELKKTKDHLLGNLMLSLETSDEIASFYGGQEILTRELISPEELAEKIQAVSAEEIMAVAQDIFKNEKLNLAIIGPFKEEEKFEEILKI
ncbi:MAG: pitrilysin family protein [Patescibacteria group bacterium]